MIEKIKSNANYLREYHNNSTPKKILFFPYAYWLSKKQLKLLNSLELKAHIYQQWEKEDPDFLERHHVGEIKFHYGFYVMSIYDGYYGLPEEDEEWGYNYCLSINGLRKEQITAWLCLLIIVTYLYFAFIGLYTTFLRWNV
jgi:hypothetical protein